MLKLEVFLEKIMKKMPCSPFLAQRLNCRLEIPLLWIRPISVIRVFGQLRFGHLHIWPNAKNHFLPNLLISNNFSIYCMGSGYNRSGLSNWCQCYRVLLNWPNATIGRKNIFTSKKEIKPFSTTIHTNNMEFYSF
jgi:hypothetical protein